MGVEIQLTTHPPTFVYVVVECPLSKEGRVHKIRIPLRRNTMKKFGEGKGGSKMPKISTKLEYH